MRKIIIFNWKMNPSSLAQARALADQTRIYADKIKNKAEIVIAAPFVYLEKLSSFFSSRSSLKLVAQDVFYENQGAYTGEISPEMLKNLGVEYVIIGHSERRQILGETDKMINKKVMAALKAGLKVVLCVGEQHRESRIKNYELRIKKAKNYIRNQLEKDLKGIHNSLFRIHNSLIVAYEPIWAISTSGTSKICQPEDAAEIIQYIKNILNSKFKIQNSKLLYGGSVDGRNIKSFIQLKEIDGVLVGGASLKAKEVRKIIDEV